MKTSKKAISFIVGFILFWVVILTLVSTFVLHMGPTEIITLITQYIKNPQLAGKPIENPLGIITGRFLVGYDDYGNPQYPNVYTCANNEEHAKQMIKDYFLSPGFSSNRYFEDEIESANWQIHPEYISVTFSRELSGNNKWNILRCDYFIHEQTHASYDKIQTSKLGTFKGKPTKETLDHLVWFLMRVGIIQLQGFNQGAEIDKIDVHETDTEIVRTDQGLYSVFNDVPPFETYKSKVGYEYRLSKSDGALFYSRTIKNE